MKEISPSELKKMIDEQHDFELIDVREEYEREIASIGGRLIPLASIMDQAGDIPKNKPVVIFCRSGKRSAVAIMELEARHGFSNLLNLRGGILAYSDEVDPSVPKY